MKAKQVRDSSEVVDLMNRALMVEYSMVVHHPRIAERVQDEETRKLVLKLGTDSMGHADTVSSVVEGLGGKPVWAFEPFPEQLSHKEIFQLQLEAEKKALQLYRQAVDLLPLSSPFRPKLSDIATVEESHISIVNDILSKLN